VDAVEQVVAEAQHLDLEQDELLKLIRQRYEETKKPN
jgi:DNA-binding transcriptional regulator YhcF (GntR family)